MDQQYQSYWFFPLLGEKKFCIYINVSHTSVIGIIHALNVHSYLRLHYYYLLIIFLSIDLLCFCLKLFFKKKLSISTEVENQCCLPKQKVSIKINAWLLKI